MTVVTRLQFFLCDFGVLLPFVTPIDFGGYDFGVCDFGCDSDGFWLLFIRWTSNSASVTLAYATLASVTLMEFCVCDVGVLSAVVTPMDFGVCDFGVCDVGCDSDGCWLLLIRWTSNSASVTLASTRLWHL